MNISYWWKKNFNSKFFFLCLSLLLFVVTYNFDQYDMSSESERHERIHVFTRNPGRFATITCSPRVDSPLGHFVPESESIRPT
jgi:hypothetical protein